MVFLDPTSDIAFKKLFGNQAKKEILMSFLNSVLERDGSEKIVDVTITDPYNNPATEWLKMSIVDVRCTDQKGRHFIVEVQVKYQNDYLERVQHYVAHAITRQLGKNERYGEIMPVIFISVLRKNLLESPDYISHHNIRNTKTQEHALKNMDFYFIELSKFNKKLDLLTSVIDKWIYLLKNAENLDTIPKQLQNPVEIEEAMDELKQGNLSPKELDAYDRFIDARRVEASVLFSAIEEGEKRGREVGEQQKACSIIKKMLLEGMDVKVIAKVTGLSVTDIEKLK